MRLGELYRSIPYGKHMNITDESESFYDNGRYEELIERYGNDAKVAYVWEGNLIVLEG